MNVTIQQFPGTKLDLELEEGTTIRQAIEIVSDSNPNFDMTGEMRRNSNVVSPDTRLYNGDRVIITKKIKGNQITVIVNKFPGAKVELMLDHGATVSQAIEQAKATLGDVEGYDIRLNSLPAEMNAAIPDNGTTQRIILTKKVKGN